MHNINNNYIIHSSGTNWDVMFNAVKLLLRDIFAEYNFEFEEVLDEKR